MKRQEFPILEFDPDKRAVIEPTVEVDNIDAPEHCVICFFSEVIDRVRQDHGAELIYEGEWEDGHKPVYAISCQGKRLAFCQGRIGAPAAAGILEEMIALGCRKFIVCGGCGVLDRNIRVGQIIVPTAAVRDEGTSFHYLPPGREVEASPEAVAAILNLLQRNDLEYMTTKTWTTDAPYRETTGKVELRKSEGCLTVEMEAAALFAVAQFRSVPLAQLLYGGDDVSGEDWDKRQWLSRTSIREQLFWLAVEACLLL